jgi:hypothetical protein
VSRVTQLCVRRNSNYLLLVAESLFDRRGSCLIRIVTARNADGFTSAAYNDRFNTITKSGDGDPFITTARIAPTDFAMMKSHVSPFASQILSYCFAPSERLFSFKPTQFR